MMTHNKLGTDVQTPADGGASYAPWEEVAPGRYMPRRIRGSYRGRALG